jgi:hypothetical protein
MPTGHRRWQLRHKSWLTPTCWQPTAPDDLEAPDLRDGRLTCGVQLTCCPSTYPSIRLVEANCEWGIRRAQSAPSRSRRPGRHRLSVGCKVRKWPTVVSLIRIVVCEPTLGRTREWSQRLHRWVSTAMRRRCP